MEFIVNVKENEVEVFIEELTAKITFQKKSEGMRVSFMSGAIVFKNPKELDFFKSTIVNIIDNVSKEWLAN